MTNENKAASQPVQVIQAGIGDDAQFKRLMSEWQLCLTTDMDKAFAAVVDFIDRRTSTALVAGYELVGWFTYEDDLWRQAPRSDWPGALAMFREPYQGGNEDA